MYKTLMARMQYVRHNCWNCGRFVWGSTGHYSCKLCGVMWQEGSAYSLRHVKGFEEIEFIDHSLVNVPCP
jgi:hypothetical protein